MIAGLAKGLLNSPAVMAAVDRIESRLIALNQSNQELATDVQMLAGQLSTVVDALAKLESDVQRQGDTGELAERNLSNLEVRLADFVSKITSIEEKLAGTVRNSNGVDVKLERLLSAQQSLGNALQVLNTPVDFLVESAQQTQSKIEGIERNLQRIEESQRASIDTIGKTAPGRGNMSVGDNRLLIRASLPSILSHRDPIYFVNADDKLIVPRLAMDGHYELATTRFVGKAINVNDHIVDVGANFGYYTVLFAMLTGWKGKVLAFEPHPLMHELLSENIMINWIDQWTQSRMVACTEQNGQVEMFTAQARAANTGPRPMTRPPGAGDDFEFSAFNAKSVRVDDEVNWLDGRVDFLKIDVEGFEPKVIAGARSIIENNPQITILMEWSPAQLINAGHNLSEFADELAGYGFSCWSIEHDGELSPLGFESLKEGALYQNIVLKR